MNARALQQYVAERDRALTNLDMEWARRVMPGASGDDVRLAAMHMTRYDCVSLAPYLRHQSGHWLREHKMRRIGGVPLLPPGELPI